MIKIVEKKLSEKLDFTQIGYTSVHSNKKIQNSYFLNLEKRIEKELMSQIGNLYQITFEHDSTVAGFRQNKGFHNTHGQYHKAYLGVDTKFAITFAKSLNSKSILRIEFIKDRGVEASISSIVESVVRNFFNDSVQKIENEYDGIKVFVEFFPNRISVSVRFGFNYEGEIEYE